jgi:NAD(P)-dependent dehydrogenase (short-subunit alcohol dehydrogenase family)
MNIVVTGASRGVGYQTALELTKSGDHTVFALSRNADGLKKLKEASPASRLVPVVCDLLDAGSLEKAVKEIEKYAGEIEILINNAGHLVRKPFAQTGAAEVATVFGVNVLGVFTLTQLLLPHLKRGRLAPKEKIAAHIVNISSMGGVQGSKKFAGLSAYSTSKGALITLTECLSEELQEAGIRANCIALGSVETAMFREAFPGVRAGSDVQSTGAWLARFALEGSLFFNGKTLQLSASTP